MNNNSFQQIQNLLEQASNYISKINEIIFQINNIINLQHQMNQMMQINMMNNMINFENNFNVNLNPLLNNQQPLQLEEKFINVIFNYQGNFINIIAQEYLPINEVINRFLKRIDKSELINNHQNKLTFLLEGGELDYSKKVGEIDIYRKGRLEICVLIKKDLCDKVEK